MQCVLPLTPWIPQADVGLVHRWLYEVAGILHCDLSPNNIMYRRINGKVYGVLNDIDPSLWTTSLTPDSTRSSQQRTGTPPYMAAELLSETNDVRLYRHDVESFFYTMLILATHYEICIPEEGRQGGVQMRRGLQSLPFEEWFDQPLYTTLGSLKRSFLLSFSPLTLSPTFEGFRYWLEDLHLSLKQGIPRVHMRSRWLCKSVGVDYQGPSHHLMRRRWEDMYAIPR